LFNVAASSAVVTSSSSEVIKIIFGGIKDKKMIHTAIKACGGVEAEI
jgi:hypothetical protein